jgi:hypothetical protein
MEVVEVREILFVRGWSESARTQIHRVTALQNYPKQTPKCITLEIDSLEVSMTSNMASLDFE